MQLKIVQAGEAVLRKAARPLGAAEIRSREIRDLIAAMRQAMYDAPGVGLAAPQVGYDLQLAVIEDKAEYMKDTPAAVLEERSRRPVPFHAIINPRITLFEGASADFFEGCLSLTGFTAVVPRARAVRVECLDGDGQPKVIEATGWYARILQHEIDHLQGTLYIDRMLPRTFMGLDNFQRLWKERSIAEVKKLAGIEG